MEAVDYDNAEINAQQSYYDEECHADIAFDCAFENNLFDWEEGLSYRFLGESGKGFWFQHRETGKKVLSERKAGETPSKYWRKN